MKYQTWAMPFVLGILCSSLPLAVAQVDQTLDRQVSAVSNTKYAGGKDDIQTIGNRKIGGSGTDDEYSLEREVRIGREYSREIEKSVELVRDRVITEYVNRIGQKLVRHSDAKVVFTIKVIDSEQINAFALPGGFLYINYGVILTAQDEAELAGVMAHEIAHVAARHTTRQMTRSRLLNLVSLPLTVFGGLGCAVEEVVMTKFSRSNEAEADYLGVEYLYKAGYDPQAVISFFERARAKQRQRPGLVTKAFSSHPQTADRIRKTQREIAKILPAREAYLVTTSEFEDVKSRLTASEHGIWATGQETDPPTLKRRPVDDSESNHSDTEDSDPGWASEWRGHLVQR